MLSDAAQNSLFEKYCKPDLRKSLQENFTFEDLDFKLNSKIDFSSVIYIDIFNFSNRIIDFTLTEVRNYLNNYYTEVMPIIKKHDGKIEKIMGDGIIVVFSKIFPDINTDRDATIKSFLCCKKLIECLYGTDFEAKAAIGIGNLFFCKTGVEQIYQENTAIGHPMTVVYRLESIADKNQILLMRDTQLSGSIVNAQNHLHGWTQIEKTVSLKGIGSTKVHVLQY